MIDRSLRALSRGARAAGTGLAVLALGVLLTAIVLELWARLQPRHWFMIFDDTLGFRLEPGARGEYRGLWMLSPHPDIRARVEINSLGMHGPERTIAKPPDTRRMLLLGDSYVQSFEVPWEQTFYALLEDRARSEAGARLETLPMGVNGYGQAQELLWLKREGVALDPDLVLLVLFLGNDIEDNSQDLGAGTARPYFALRDGQLVQVAEPDDAARWKYRMSRYVRSFLAYREIAVRVSTLEALARKLGLVNYPAGHGTESPERLAERRRAAWELTAALIQEIGRVAREGGADFLLAFHGSYPAGSSEAQEHVSKLCRDAQLDCLDLASELEGRDEYLFSADEHWTARGHQRVAELMWSRWRDILIERRSDLAR